MRCTPEALAAALTKLDAQALRRRRLIAEPLIAQGATIVRVAGRRLVNFCSNDYLGLATDAEVAAAMAEAARHSGAGSGASHLICGHGPEHAALEEELAAFTGRERALLFSSGYMANLGVLGALANRHDMVFEDRLNHASLIDAVRLCGARVRRYPHADATALATLLPAASQSSLIVTDGVFSMDGDLAPLPALAALAAARQVWLIVDDAHGLGVLGAEGGGSCQHFALDARAVPVLVGTLGKAFGSFGAFVAGSSDLIEYVMQRARTYIYTTALPQPVAAATRAALRVARRDAWRRDKLRALITRLRERARMRGVALSPSATPIQPLILGSAQRALDISRQLHGAGFWVAAIRPPTVPRGMARLRITLSAGHTESDVDGLVDALARALQSSPATADA